MALFLRVKNLDRFQHYSRRRPPWIKLYRTVITGEEGQFDDFLTLPECEQWQLVRIWVLASQCDDGLLIHDERWLRLSIRSEKKVPLAKFVREGWLEKVEVNVPADASAVLAQPAPPMLENERDFAPDVGGPEKTEGPEKKRTGAVTRDLAVAANEQHRISKIIESSLAAAP